MTLAEQVGMKVAQLPPDRQRAVLDYVEFLVTRSAPPGPRRDPEGLLADLRSNLTFEDFAVERREMASNFPRDFPDPAAGDK